MEAGKLIYKVQVNMAGFKKQLNTIEAQGKKSTKSFSSGFSAMKGPAIIAAVAVAGLGAAILKCAKMAGIQEREEKKLGQVIKSTGFAAGITKDEVLELASSLQKVTEFGDEAIIPAQSILLTFTKIGKDVFPQATEAILDMSVMLGQDLKSSAIQLGKALNDPILGVTALRRVGIQLSAQQEMQIKSFTEQNKIMEAQKIILGELSTQMGGTARAAADTYLGSITQLKNATGDLAEEIGIIFIPMLKSLNKTLTKATQSLTSFLKEMITNVIDKGVKEWSFGMEKLEKKAGGIRPTEEQIKAWKERYSELLNINQDYAKKLAQQNGDQLRFLALEEQSELDKLEKLKTANKEKYEQARLKITKFYAKERTRAEMASFSSHIAMAQNVVGQLGAIFSQYAMNQSLALDNEREKRSEAISEWYDEQKTILDNQVLDEKTRSKKLESLDQERARREKKLEEEIDKKKRKIEYEAAKRQKFINIVQSIMNTALGITNVWSRWAWNPPVAWGLTALVGGLGATQTALIAQQPLPKMRKGGVVEATSGGVPVIAAEGGYNEMIAPLTPEVFEEFAEGIAESQRRGTLERPGGAQVIKGNVYLYGEKIGEFISRGTEDGTIRIANRSII